MVKTAPHFGHFTLVSFDTPPHPKERTANIANAIKMLTILLIRFTSFRQLIYVFCILGYSFDLLNTGDTNIRNHLCCQEKNYPDFLLPETRLSLKKTIGSEVYFFFFGVAFFVVFLVVPHFLPQAIMVSPP
jgi:hypothetical protein